MTDYVLINMFTLNEEQRNIIGWFVTIGMCLGVSAFTVLTTYCLYCLYKVIKNFSNKN